jgi:hypothetical protein
VLYAQRGFNVYNLGIKRRMLYIGKIISFYILKNVRKCSFCEKFHSKLAKSSILTPEIYLVLEGILLSKNTEIYADSKFVDTSFKKSSLKRYMKNLCKF